MKLEANICVFQDYTWFWPKLIQCFQTKNSYCCPTNSRSLSSAHQACCHNIHRSFDRL